MFNYRIYFKNGETINVRSNMFTEIYKEHIMKSKEFLFEKTNGEKVLIQTEQIEKVELLGANMQAIKEYVKKMLDKQK